MKQLSEIDEINFVIIIKRFSITILKVIINFFFLQTFNYQK